MCEVKGESINEERERFWRDYASVIKAAAIADNAYERAKRLLRQGPYWHPRWLERKALTQLQEAAENLYELGFRSADDKGEAQLFEDLFAEAKEELQGSSS